MGQALPAIQAHMSHLPAAVAYGQPLGVSAAMYQRCKLLVGPDGGGAHLAAAVGTPTVRLYGPASSAVFGPWPPAETAKVLVTERARVRTVRSSGTPPCGPTDLRPASRPGSRRRAECERAPVARFAVVERLTAKIRHAHPGRQAGSLGRFADDHARLARLRATFKDAHIGVLTTFSDAAALRQSLDSFDRLRSPSTEFEFDRPSDARAEVARRALGLAAERCRTGDPAGRLVLLHHLTTPPGIAKYAALSLGCGAAQRVSLDNGRGR